MFAMHYQREKNLINQRIMMEQRKRLDSQILRAEESLK